MSPRFTADRDLHKGVEQRDRKLPPSNTGLSENEAEECLSESKTSSARCLARKTTLGRVNKQRCTTVMRRCDRPKPAVCLRNGAEDPK